MSRVMFIVQSLNIYKYIHWILIYESRWCYFKETGVFDHQCLESHKRLFHHDIYRDDSWLFKRKS